MKEITLLNIDEFTDEEVVDYVREFLIKQGEPSYYKTRCCYKIDIEDKILKCAVGCLLPEEYYDSNMESKVFNDAFVEVFFSNTPISDEKLKLLKKLQKIHDGVARKSTNFTQQITEKMQYNLIKQ